jgi:hypothetical protein
MFHIYKLLFTFFLFNQVIMLKIREISFKFVKLISYTSIHETISHLKYSGNYIYHLLYIKKSVFFHIVFICSSYDSQNKIISLNNINRLIFETKSQHVYWVFNIIK